MDDLLAVWGFWRLLNHEGPGIWRVAAVSAVIFGLAQLAKYTSAYLVPILLLIALATPCPGGPWCAQVIGGTWRRGVTGLKFGLFTPSASW